MSPTDGSIQVDRYFDSADILNSVDEYGFAYVFLFTDCKTKALTVTELLEEKARAVAHRSSGRLRRYKIERVAEGRLVDRTKGARR